MAGHLDPPARRRLDPNPSQLCSGCAAPGTKQLGFDRWCETCYEEIVGPIREHVNALNAFNGVGIASTRAEGYAPGFYHLQCDSCDATWTGKRGEPCDWCTAAHARLIEYQRQLLLHPDWLTIKRGPRYDALDDATKAVWDRTRGQAVGTTSKTAWLERLARGVKAGLITIDEVRQACERYDKHIAS